MVHTEKLIQLQQQLIKRLEAKVKLQNRDARISMTVKAACNRKFLQI